MVMKQLITALLAGLMLKSAVALTSLTVALDWYINPSQGPLLVAEQAGIFKKHGLAVHFITPTQSGEPLKLVLANRAQIAVSYPSYLEVAQQKDLPLIKLGDLLNQSIDCLTTLKNSHIVRLKQLEGKTIGVAGGLSVNNRLKEMLARAGVQFDKVHIVDVEMDLLSALLSEKVNAVWGFTKNVEPVLLKARGVSVKLFLPTQYGLANTSGYILVMKEGVLPPRVQHAFLAALTQAAKMIERSPNDAWQLLVKSYPQALAPTAQAAHDNELIWQASTPLFKVKT